jgi:hypothetical protein
VSASIAPFTVSSRSCCGYHSVRCSSHSSFLLLVRDPLDREGSPVPAGLREEKAAGGGRVGQRPVSASGLRVNRVPPPPGARVVPQTAVPVPEPWSLRRLRLGLDLSRQTNAVPVPGV